jgi:hypothetical protein
MGGANPHLCKCTAHMFSQPGISCSTGRRVRSVNETRAVVPADYSLPEISFGKLGGGALLAVVSC